MNKTSDIVQDAIHVPMGEILRSTALAVADAQLALDQSAMTVAELMSGQRVLRDPDTGGLVDTQGRSTTTPTVTDSRIYFGYTRESGGIRPTKLSMMELGFTPMFYQFVDTLIHLKITLSLNRDESKKIVTTGTTVDATYAGAYGFDAKYASVLEAKLAPAPPPPSLHEWLEEKRENAGG